MFVSGSRNLTVSGGPPCGSLFVLVLLILRSSHWLTETLLPDTHVFYFLTSIDDGGGGKHGFIQRFAGHSQA